MKRKYELIPAKTDVILTCDRQLWQARYSPCGKYLIACGYDATIRRWDVSGAAPQELPAFAGHDGWLQCMVIHPHNQTLLAADSWGRLSCWNYATDAEGPLWTHAEAHDGWIRGLALSPDGNTVATAGNDGIARLWSTSDGKALHELPHPLRLYSVCFHPNGRSLVTGDLEGVIRHWSLDSFEITRRLDASRLYAHDVENERIQHCGGVRLLAFDAHGAQLVAGGQKDPQGGFAQGTPCVIVYNWDSGEVVREMPMGGSDDGFAYDVQFHPEGFVMATSSAFPGKGHVWFWRPEEESAFFSSNKLANGRSLSVHPDGSRIAFLSSDSRNGNGRPLKDGEYQGGSAQLRIMPLSVVKESA